MSHIIVGTFHDYAFYCDHNGGCGQSHTVRARNIDQARAKLKQEGWASSGSESFCPEHASLPVSAT